MPPSSTAHQRAKDGACQPRRRPTAILAELEGEDFTVGSGEEGHPQKESLHRPSTTSTLQQEASRKLGFQARRTMKAAQELYEGVEVAGMGAVGLITYMRTDSLRISDEAQADAAKYIGEKFGIQYLPPSKRVYKSKSNAQDGHEAIRPTMIEMSPDKVKDSLSADQYKLYKLIWERFLASQMANALLQYSGSGYSRRQVPVQGLGLQREVRRLHHPL